MQMSQDKTNLDYKTILIRVRNSRYHISIVMECKGTCYLVMESKVTCRSGYVMKENTSVWLLMQDDTSVCYKMQDNTSVWLCYA
jgi:hypothetical protein